jgi:exosome complex component CSL4
VIVSRVDQLKGRIVYPGQPLAVIEEFIPGDGVYVAGGTIYAAVMGIVEVDTGSRSLRVKPLTRQPRLPRKGSIVHGYVAAIPREDLAIIKITHDDRMAPFSDGFTGVLHISQAADHFPSTIYEYVRVGDAVKVQVLNNHNPFIVTIKGPGLGVIAASCSRCGLPLYKVPGYHHLQCLNCNNKESRKVASGYLYVKR